jgi:hypothetical protein
MQLTRRIALASGAALLAGAAFAGGAGADPIDMGPFHDEGTDIIQDLCGVAGLTARHDFVVDGRFLFNPHGPDGLPYYREHATITDTYTLLATGEVFTLETIGNGKDLKVTDNGDGTTTILSQQTSNQVLYGPDGTVLALNVGQTRFEFLVDNGGTPADPSDDQFLEFLGEVRDPTGHQADLCGSAAEA